MVLLLVALTVLITACSHPPAKDYAGLVGNLRQAGVTVEPAGEVAQPFFGIKAQVIQVNGQNVQVLEYPDEATAQLEAGQIRSDGSLMGNSMVDWIFAPRFYRNGRLIVLYAGDDATTRRALEAELGAQFAGR